MKRIRYRRSYFCWRNSREKLKVFPSEKLLPLLELVNKHVEKDNLSKAAPAEYSHLDSRIRYVVYGHSHVPLQMPVRVVGPQGEKQHVYLNTGTWRRRYHKTKEGLGFIGWKNLTYLVFYRKEEKGLDFPAETRSTQSKARGIA
jgi:hypothetical protein